MKLKHRIYQFKLLRNYQRTARLFGVNHGTIRKQMLMVARYDPEVAQIVSTIRKKSDECYRCQRPFDTVEYRAKNLCNTCYVYFRRRDYAEQ